METNHEEWLLKTSKSKLDFDLYSARSWLLTAKTLFPQSFRLQFEEYNLEMQKKNYDECARVLNEIYRDFPSEAHLWEEVELLIQATEKSNDAIRKDVFSQLPAITQQRMIIASAESRVNITQYCRLMMLLMSKFPETVAQFGLSITEKLVETEKRDAETSPVNHCRKVLVREVLPVICKSSSLSVSNKHIYKWLQKATEFYACFFTSKEETDNKEAWKEMDDLLSTISVRCDWNTDKNKASSLTDRMSFMRDLFRRSLTDVVGAVNRKQIFYSTIILLFEAASRYSIAMGCAAESGEKAYVHIADVSGADNQNMEPSGKLNAPEIRETFHVGKEAWNILHSCDSFEKDFNHLVRRWKCDKWIWFQLFWIDVLVYAGNHKAALSRLKLVEEKTRESEELKPVLVRVFVQLSSVHFSLEQHNESCEYIFSALSHLSYEPSDNPQYTTRLFPPVNPPARELYVFNHAEPPQTRLRTASTSVKDLLEFWVHVLITSLQRVLLSVEDDQVLGHVIVLSQHDWPRWRPTAERVLQRIVEKRSFKFESFFAHVINVDLLEEFACIKNQSACKLTLCRNAVEKVHVTRGVNREAEEDFWSALNLSVERSRNPIDDVIHSHLVESRHSLMSCLKLVEPR